MKLLLLLQLFSFQVLAATNLAEINGKTITSEEFEKKYKLNLNSYQAFPITKKDVLDDMVSRELAIQAAKKEGFESREDVQERIGTVLFTAYIEDKLRDKFNKVKITDSEVKAYYSKYPTVRTSHILVKVHPLAAANAQNNAKQKIDRLYATIKANPKKFEELASKESDAPEAVEAGDLNFRRRDELDPYYYAAALKLKDGSISAPVKSQFGWHIIKRTAVLPLEQADKGKVRAQIFDERRKQIFDSFFQDLRKNNNVKVNYSLLKEK